MKVALHMCLEVCFKSSITLILLSPSKLPPKVMFSKTTSISITPVCVTIKSLSLLCAYVCVCVCVCVVCVYVCVHVCVCVCMCVCMCVHVCVHVCACVCSREPVEPEPNVPACPGSLTDCDGRPMTRGAGLIKPPPQAGQDTRRTGQSSHREGQTRDV